MEKGWKGDSDMAGTNPESDASLDNTQAPRGRQC
jgi:hypothetical protein